MARQVINFAMNADDCSIFEYLRKRTGITSNTQLVRLVAREAAESRGWRYEAAESGPGDEGEQRAAG